MSISLRCRRELLQSTPVTVTSDTTTGNPTQAQRNIRNAVANGSLQQQLTQLGLTIVPGSLGTSNVSLRDIFFPCKCFPASVTSSFQVIPQNFRTLVG